MIRFRFNPEKAVQVVLWVLNNKDGINKHKLAKILFFADRYHFNNYGRPVVGGRHSAMKYGPVHSEIYDMLKSPYCVYSDVLELERLPFYTKTKYVHADEGSLTDFDLISESDNEALTRSYEICKDLSFSELVEISHKDIGWINAWKICETSDADSHSIDYVDMMDETEDKQDKLEWFEATSKRLSM